MKITTKQEFLKDVRILCDNYIVNEHTHYNETDKRYRRGHIYLVIKRILKSLNGEK